MPPVAASHHLPEPVQRFCASYHLLPHLETALRLAEEAFAPVERLQVSLEVDPETDDQKVVIDVAVRNRADSVLDQKAAYTRRWVESAPQEIRERIVLLYNLI